MKTFVLVMLSIGVAFQAPGQSASGDDPNMRALHFPSDRSVGELIDLDRPVDNALHDWWWGAACEKIGVARGDVVVPKAIRLGLVVSEREFKDPYFINDLLPDSFEYLQFPSNARAEPGAVAVAHVVHLTGLRTLVMEGLDVPSNALVLLENLKSLERLYLHSTSLDEAGFGSIAGLKTLTGLRFEPGENSITTSQLSGLAGFSSIEELFIGGRAIDGRGLVYLSRLPFLRVLHFGVGDQGPGGLEYLPACTSLERLEFYDLTDEGLKGLPYIPSLRTLTIQGKHPGFSAEAFANLALQSGVETLNITGRYWDETIAELRRMQSLKALILQGLFQDTDYMTDVSLSHIGEMRSLESLEVYTGRFTEEGIRFLAQIPDLKHLSLTNTRLTDAGLRNIAGIHSVEDLTIRAERLTDEDIACLEELGNLKRLCLFYNRSITDEAIAGLREKLPGLEVEEKPPRKNKP
jgi:hypothetical protein